ncbi:FMN-binding protein [Actinoplanes sp. NPDC026619]|uniref:FMN-binding protein n=1 Tax=Actinoplanes sp. NPDC026619 TaxID=3155798 RepID=UPI0033EE52EA
MRRSTAAAVGTLTGAALIVGVRLSVQPAAIAAPPAVDLVDSTPSASASGKAPAKKPAASSSSKAASSSDKSDDDAAKNGLKAGVFKGKGSQNIYGTIQVSIKIEDGKITAAEATYPVTGNSATINPGAVAKLKQETLQKQSADVAAVSGATYTSQSYKESLQAALDSAKA